MKFRYVGEHADTFFKGTADETKHVPVGPGDFIDLTDKEKDLEGNKTLFDNNLLLEVNPKNASSGN